MRVTIWRLSLGFILKCIVLVISAGEGELRSVNGGIVFISYGNFLLGMVKSLNKRCCQITKFDSYDRSGGQWFPLLPLQMGWTTLRWNPTAFKIRDYFSMRMSKIKFILITGFAQLHVLLSSWLFLTAYRIMASSRVIILCCSLD